MNNYLQHDIWMAPITIDETNNKIRVFTTFASSSLQATITLTEGTYYMLYSSAWSNLPSPASGTSTANPYKSLLAEIVTKFNASTPVVSRGENVKIAWELSNVPGDNYELFRAVKFVNLNYNPDSIVAFGFVPDHVDNTFDLSILGFQNVYGSGLNTFLQPRSSLRYFWVSPKQANRKVSYVKKKVEAATEDIEIRNNYQLNWSSRRVRFFRYHYVPAILIHKNRGLLDDYTLSYGIANNSINLAFEWIWEEGSKMNDLIVIHDIIPFQWRGYNPSTEVVDSVTSATYEQIDEGKVERIRLFDARQRSDYEACVTMDTMLGEFYDLQIACVQVPFTNNYDQ